MSKVFKKSSKVITSLLVASLAFGTVSYAATDSNNGNGNGKSSYSQDQKVVARVNAEKAIEHIRYLSEEIGTRPGGLEGEKKAADYIAKTLQGYGYDVEYQYFPVADQYIANVAFNDGTVWEMAAAPNGKISEESVKGEVVFVEGNDYSQVKGKIAVMARAATTAAYREQVNNAVAAGAKGVILQSLVGGRGNYGQTFNPSLVTKVDVPVYGSSYIHGEWLKEQLTKGPVEISLTSKHYSNLQSVNVIATKKAKTRSENTKEVILGAHHDSVVGAPGANDNASGVGLMLELARVYQGYNTDKDLKFIAFGSEERGLLGSRYYVDQLTQEQRDKIEAVFVPDMVATSYDKAKNLYAMTPDGSTNIVTESTVSAGARLGNSDILPGTFGSSDHVPFHNAGIPAALFIWMGVDSWSPLVYHIEKVYHTPQDTIADNVSVERMQSALDIIGSGLFDTVRKKTPALDNNK